jgi:signal transduction histidine kinase
MSANPFRLSFRTKVLVPVMGVMVLLVAVAMAVVNMRFKAQLERDTARSLEAADNVFRNALQVRVKNLLLRYRYVPNEPRLRALLQLGEPNTLQYFLNELMTEFDADTVAYLDMDNRMVAHASREASIDGDRLADVIVPVTTRAMSGQPSVDIVGIEDHLLEIAAVPVTVRDETIVGVMVFGTDLAPAQALEYGQLTGQEVVLVTEKKSPASTIASAAVNAECVRLFRRAMQATAGGPAQDMATITTATDSYLACVRSLPSLGKQAGGYVLLASFEEPLLGLRQTQRVLIAIAVVGILLSSWIVWVLVSRVTAPLGALAESAEAVGRGDFTRRVQVVSRDETGELATTFNRMTENLQASREQLEQTFENLKTTQQQLVQSEKLSGIGEFVAGVTHELNNPLTCILGFAELLEDEALPDATKQDVTQIVNNAHRCRRIVQSLLSFARQHKAERKPVQVNDLIDGSLEIVAYQLRTGNIEVERKFDASLPRVLADPHQIQQVVINILNNARQAIEEHRRGGKVTITTERKNGIVRVQFQDNGPGIPPEIAAKIFDPFFTTKEIGKGTGLGLSLCYGIMKEHGGSIAVEGRPGEGALFNLELPVAETAGAAKETDKGPAPGALNGAGMKALVVDDEDAILALVRAILQGAGFHVDTAGGGEAALRFLRQTKYEVVLCDVKMPGMTGEQVYEALRVIDPAGADRLVFMTGDVVNDRTQQVIRECGNVCVAKPFTPDEIRAAFQKVLGRK